MLRAPKIKKRNIKIFLKKSERHSISRLNNIVIPANISNKYTLRFNGLPSRMEMAEDERSGVLKFIHSDKLRQLKNSQRYGIHSALEQNLLLFLSIQKR